MIWCDSILLGQTYNTTCFMSFYKYLENVKGSDLPYSYALRTHIESVTEEVIQLRQENK